MFNFFIISLAIWRLSRAMAWERGPSDVFAKTRAAVARRRKATRGADRRVPAPRGVLTYLGLERGHRVA